MRSPPEDLSGAEVASALAQHWALRCRSIEHVPIGSGAYHWLAELVDGTRRWISVDDLIQKDYLAPEPDQVFAILQTAFATADRLRRDGLEFVLSPMSAADGSPVHRVNTRYAISVFPHIRGTPGTFGAPLPIAYGRALAHALARLHQAEAPTSLREAPRDFAGRAALVSALHALDTPWHTGPHAEPARLALAANVETVNRLISRFDALLAEVFTANAPENVITHGEPHPANVLFTDSGMLLVDWDTVAVGPRERDVWFLGPEPLQHYAAVSKTSPRDAALRFYGLRWLMEDIAVYLAVLRVPHVDSANTRHALYAVRVSLAPERTRPHLAWTP